jgi:hypothetical protein
MDSRKDANFFHWGMCWVKQLGRQTRPRWTMNYSMPFAFVQQVMTQSTWDTWVGNLGHPGAKTIIMAQALFRYGQDARMAFCEKRDTGVPGWSWKRAHIPNARFVDDEDDEDWGKLPPGIPPFRFRDPHWTAGPEAEIYPEIGQGLYESPPPIPRVVNINVIYSGIYDEVTGTAYQVANPGKHTGDEGGEIALVEPSSRRIHYTDWPEGVLRNLCFERDISNFGEKSVLVARLEQFDAAETERHVSSGENTPEAPEESTAPRNKLTLLTYTLEWSTLVIAFKQAVYEDTGIPVGQQRAFSLAKAGQFSKSPPLAVSWATGPI